MYLFDYNYWLFGGNVIVGGGFLFVVGLVLVEKM